MEKLFAEFMHIYFWVFIVLFIVGIIAFLDEEYRENTYKQGNRSNFWATVGITLWIMSFYY